MKGSCNALNLNSENDTYHGDIISACITMHTGVFSYTCATTIRDIKILGGWWYVLLFKWIDECCIGYIDKGGLNEGFNEKEGIYHWWIAELTTAHNSGPWIQSSLVMNTLAMYIIH